ncbi:MAG: PKD domain-containing protein [Porphyromonadaceae bacterium]|nr:MAG: PKD domain-containing protein [Porphyromonadaceae bacterium]
MKKPVLIFVTFLLPFVLNAQIEYPGKPWSQELKLKSSPAIATFSGLSPKAAIAYLSSFFNPELKAMVFAYPFDTLLTADRQGTWETLHDGSRIWRLSIYSPKALSINLIFSRFKLPAGADVYLYTPDYQTIRGAFTSKNQTASGVLATVPLPGDRVTVELNLPANAEFMPILEISKVSHDFKGFFSSSLSEHSGDCNVDINCPAGANWQTEKRSVVKFIRGGVWLCSGALINNVRNDGRPLLLTANHTIGNETHAEQTVFFFRYERPSCGNGNGTLQYTLSGSKLLATTSRLDFSLVELSSAPPQNYEPFYAGWDRRVVTYLDTVTCIHHPNGDVKKISKSYRKVFTRNFGGGYDSLAHWNISAWDIGTTEPGSSGSPLFNNDHRIVGDLTGGDASCASNFNDYFQKFSVSWDKYPDSSNQLKHWLDPAQTGLFVLNGYDPFSGGKPIANFTIRPEQIQVGRKVYFTDRSTGLPYSWSWSFENGKPAVSKLQVPEPVKFSLPGTYHITLLVKNEQGIDSLQQTITVSDYPSYAISETRIVPERQIELTDQSTGHPVSVSWSVTGASTPVYAGPTVELRFLNPGEYSVSEIVEFPDFTDTLNHYNQIRVIPDVLAYRSYTFRNVQTDEHTGYSTMGSQGYLPGSNSLGILAFAEAFRNPSDTTFIINGITIPIEVRSKWSANYYLPLVVWNANKQVVVRDSVLVSNYQPESRLTKWLRSPVNFDTLVYVGFEVRPWDQGTFVSKMATDRGEIGNNTAFVVKGTQWQPITDVAGIHTSFDFSLETSVLMNSYNQEIRILPNYNDGNFTINLGTLVFNKVDLSIYNIKGQKVIADVSKSDNQITFQILPPVPGVYVVRLIIDNFQFATKLMIIRH